MKCSMSATLVVYVACFVSPATFGSRILEQVSSPDGRVRARLTVSPEQPRLSDTIMLTLAVEADETLEVEMPIFGTALGDLTIQDVSRKVSGMGTESERTELDLTTRPTRGGEMPIWPITIRYRDRREGLQNNSYSLELPASRLEVRADVTPENASLDKIPTSRELIDIPSKNRMVYAVLLAVIVVAVLALLLLRRRKREVDVVVSKFTLQEIAIKRLADLIERRLHETDVKRFFIELSGIVRWYIEQQTQIRAPELTTEEFLRELTSQWKNRTMFPAELQECQQVWQTRLPPYCCQRC